MSMNEPELRKSALFNHNQIPVTSPEGDTITLDEGIAPLVRAMWKHGVETTGSCQGPSGERGTAWISFRTVEAAQTFLNHLHLEHNSDPDSLYQRIGNGYLDYVVPPKWLVWEWAMLPFPDTDGEGPQRFYFDVQVDFPPSDIPELVRRLTDE